MKLTYIIIGLVAFIAGITAHSAFASDTMTGYEIPAAFTGKAIARATPTDRIAENQIMVYKDRVVLDIQDAIWAKFTATNSMDPVLDEKANAIEIIPTNDDEINEGDIIAYNHPDVQGTIIHRVIKKGEDQLGTYYIVKGDNNPSADPGKVRFEQVKSVVVAIIY